MTFIDALIGGAAGFALAGVAALLVLPVIARAHGGLLAGAAAAFGVAAAFAPGAPTGVGAIDLLLRVALVVGCVYAAAYAPPWAVLAAAILAGLATDHSDYQAVALACIGAMAALM